MSSILITPDSPAQLKEVERMKKTLCLLLGLFLLVSGVAQARTKEKQSKVVIYPTQMKAGDYITDISASAISDNTKPWFVKDLSSTAVAIGTVASNTATAVSFDFFIPANYKSGGQLYALVKPAAAAFTFTLRADVQLHQNVMASPTTVTAVTQGTNTSALAAAALDNLSLLNLPNAAFNSNIEPNTKVGVYLGRSSGTAQNVYLHEVFFLYEPLWNQKR